MHEQQDNSVSIDQCSIEFLDVLSDLNIILNDPRLSFDYFKEKFPLSEPLDNEEILKIQELKRKTLKFQKAINTYSTYQTYDRYLPALAELIHYIKTLQEQNLKKVQSGLKKLTRIKT